MIPGPILVVDDESDLRNPLREALMVDGYTVDDAASANAAMAMVERKHYPVILTDLHMPGGPSGLDLIAAVKGKDPRTLCIVITGYASLDVAVEAIKRGAYDFVQKPFKLIEIEAVLDRALEHARLLDQLEFYQKELESRIVGRVEALNTFHQEVLRLQAMLMDVQGEVEEESLLAPFIRYLEERFAPDGYVVLLPNVSGWDILMRKGLRPWAAFGSLPPPDRLREVLEWGWRDGYPDGHLIPLRKGEWALGALFLGFEQRSSFDPRDPVFALWKSQMEAALNGLRCLRDYAAYIAEATKVRGQG